MVTRQVSCLATTLWSMFYAPVSSKVQRIHGPTGPAPRIQRDTESGHPASGADAKAKKYGSWIAGSWIAGSSKVT